MASVSAGRISLTRLSMPEQVMHRQTVLQITLHCKVIRSRPYFCSVEVQLTMTVSGAAAVAAFCGLVLTRNRCPSLVTAYMLVRR